MAVKESVGDAGTGCRGTELPAAGATEVSAAAVLQLCQPGSGAAEEACSSCPEMRAAESAAGCRLALAPGPLALLLTTS